MIEFIFLFIFEAVFFLLLKREKFYRCHFISIDQEKWRIPPSSTPESSDNKIISTLLNRSPSTDTIDATELMERIRDSLPFHGIQVGDFHCNPWHFPENHFLEKLQKNPHLMVNCGTYSHLFRIAGRAVNLPVRIVIGCMKDFSESHVLCEFWDANRKQWVLADLLYNCLFECDGRLLDLVGVHEVILEGKPLTFQRGGAKQESLSSVARLREYLNRGLFSHLLQVPEASHRPGTLFPTLYVFNFSGETKWWWKTRILQLTFFLFPIGFFVAWFFSRH